MMTKQQERDDIKKALADFKGKQGVPYSSEEKFIREVKGRDNDRKENTPTSNRKGFAYRKKK